MTGYYSLIQYCPCASRLEAVNVGVMLIIPGGFKCAKVSSDCARVKKLFDGPEHDWKIIRSAVLAICERIVDNEPWTKEDLESFAASRGNQIVITPPRFVKVGILESTCERLFDELVREPTQPEE